MMEISLLEAELWIVKYYLMRIFYGNLNKRASKDLTSIQWHQNYDYELIFSHNFGMKQAMTMKLGSHVELWQSYYPMCQSSCMTTLMTSHHELTQKKLLNRPYFDQKTIIIEQKQTT